MYWGIRRRIRCTTAPGAPWKFVPKRPDGQSSPVAAISPPRTSPVGGHAHANATNVAKLTHFHRNSANFGPCGIAQRSRIGVLRSTSMSRLVRHLRLVSGPRELQLKSERGAMLIMVAVCLLALT